MFWGFFLENFPEAGETLNEPTCAVLSVRQVWRNYDSPLLPNADSQQALIHPQNYVSHPYVGVISAVPLVAVVVIKRSKIHFYG